VNALRIIRAAIPDASEEFADMIVWGRTPYPFAPVTPRSLYRAADRWRRACERGVQLCEFCDRIAAPDEWMCPNCTAALNRHRHTDSPGATPDA
jgi:hypothetical protein